MACCCDHLYTISPFIQMCEEADYERRFSVMTDHSCHLLDTITLINEEIKVDLDFSCIDFMLDIASFVQRA